MKPYRHRWLGWVLAIALAFNTLVPFFAQYHIPASGIAATKLASIFGEKLLICTGDGFALVSLKDLKTGKAPKPHHSYACALCYTGGHPIGKLLLVAASLVFFHRLRPKGGSLLALYRDTVSKRFFRTSCPPRAPPLSA